MENSQENETNMQPVEKPAAAKVRYPLFDNMKFVLITFVVIGHVINPYLNECLELKVFYQWIYMFHMPAFLFVGGMFGKKLCTPGKGLRINTIAFYLLMGVLFYTALWGWAHLYNPSPKFDILHVGSIPWYFFAMAALGASTAVVSKIKGGAKVVLPIAVVLAVAAGFVDEFDDFLVLGRIFTYAPFYFAGYYLSPEACATWAQKQRRRVWPILLAVIAMVGLYALLYINPDNVAGSMVGLATGHNPYSTITHYPVEICALLRLANTGIAGIMTIVCILLVPQRNCIITGLGSRTLQVYIFHAFVYKTITGFQIDDILIPYMPWMGWALVAASVLLTALIAWPKWPEKFFRLLRRSIRIDNAE